MLIRYQGVFWVCLGIILSGCTSFKKHTPVELQSYENHQDTIFKETENVRFQTTQPVKKWWTQLNDKTLDHLIDQALLKNHDLEIARNSLESARAYITQADYAQFPIVTSSASGNKQLLSEQNNFGPLSDRKVGFFTTGFDAFWELDLFGRVSETVKQAKTNADISQAVMRGVSISMAAEIVRNYTLLRGLQKRLEIIHQSVDNTEKTYKLFDLLARAGDGDVVASQQAEVQLQQFRAIIPALNAQIHTAINRLSVLSGQAPLALNQQLQPAKDLPSVPHTLSIGDMSSLLRRRPDIFKAERQLSSSVSEYNIRVSDLYPRIQLLGSLGFSATHLTDIGTSGTSRYTIGPSLQWAAFDLGRVKTRITSANFEVQAKLSEFEKTVLLALEGVNNALFNFSEAEKTKNQLSLALNASKKANHYSKLRLNAGVENQLDYLQIQKTMLTTQDQVVQADTNTMLELVSVYKELGGGWE